MQNARAFSIIKSCVVVLCGRKRAARAADAKREGELCRQGAAVFPPSDICQKESMIMTYSQQVQNMCPITKGPKHGPAPIPEEGAWVKAYEIKDISGYTHGVGWCAPQQGTCKLAAPV